MARQIAIDSCSAVSAAAYSPSAMYVKRQIVLRGSDAASIADGAAQFQTFQSAAPRFFKRALPPQRETQIAQHIGRAPAITGGAIQRQTGFVVLSGDGEMALHVLHVAEAVQRERRVLLSLLSLEDG